MKPARLAQLPLAAVIVFLLAMIAAPAPTFAQGGADANKEAAALKADGDKAMDTLRFEDALTAYDASYAKHPDAALLYNQGRALEGLNRFPEALAKLEAFEKQASPELLRKVGDQLGSHLAEVRGRVATLIVEGPPDGAIVRLGDRVLGTAPLAPLRVNAGKVHLESSKDGFHPESVDVDLPGGKETRVLLRQSPRDPRGTVAVSSPVEGARVFIDGKPSGTVPIETQLAPGPHVIHVEHDGYEASESRVEIKTGERTPIDVPLFVRPVTMEWWLWALVGVGVAGGVVAVVVPTTVYASAEKGSMNPGQIEVESFAPHARIIGGGPVALSARVAWPASGARPGAGAGGQLGVSLAF